MSLELHEDGWLHSCNALVIHALRNPLAFSFSRTKAVFGDQPIPSSNTVFNIVAGAKTLARQFELSPSGRIRGRQELLYGRTIGEETAAAIWAT
jgi:hypothetical protein